MLEVCGGVEELDVELNMDSGDQLKEVGSVFESRLALCTEGELMEIAEVVVVMQVAKGRLVVDV